MKISKTTPGYITPEAQAQYIAKMGRKGGTLAKKKTVARNTSPTGSINPAFRRLSA